MKCPKCNGRGMIGKTVPNILVGKGYIFADYECDQCNGSGEVSADEPMTNEEWLKQCTTEQLAEWFGAWHQFSCVFCKHWQNGCIYNHNQLRCAIEVGKSNKELWMEWLKQPHKE